jgi:hypothetical protein
MPTFWKPLQYMFVTKDMNVAVIISLVQYGSFNYSIDEAFSVGVPSYGTGSGSRVTEQ